ncbi:MAG: hypothetical protein KDB69_01950, partial [Acidimicrobiia bacterium]|nr:hypothetical protein [Acidimicrobiia bacterium]
AIAADLVRHAQYNVTDLGTNLPPEQFARAVDRGDSVIAVAVGVTTAGQDDELSSTIDVLRRVAACPIVVGGRGVDAATATRLGADHYARSAQDLVALLDDIIVG